MTYGDESWTFLRIALVLAIFFSYQPYSELKPMLHTVLKSNIGTVNVWQIEDSWVLEDQRIDYADVDQKSTGNNSEGQKLSNNERVQ